MEEWRFVFEDNTGQNNGITSGVENTLGSGTSQKSSKRSDNQEKKGFSETVFEKSTEKIFEQSLVSPLNTVTGGLANPIYKAGKRLLSGNLSAGAMGGIAVNLAIAGINFAISKLESRMQSLQQQATQLNNNDNALIRAGRVSQATYYSADITGIKKTTNRS